jgi:hypothetical protein
MHRAFIYALRTGNDAFFKDGFAHAAAMKALAYTDPLGGSIGTGTYGDATGGGFRNNAGGSFIWAVCAHYFRDGRHKWLLENVGLPADKAGYGIYQGLAINPQGPGAYPTDESLEPVRPDEWLAVATPMDAYYYEKAQDSTRWAKLDFPVSEAFTKVAIRDGWGREDAMLALMGEHSGWVPGLDANSIIRYTDAGQIWLCHNTSKTSSFYRNGVCVGHGGPVSPFPWGARLRALERFEGGTFVATEIPRYNGADWTRHIFRRRHEFTVVVDTLRLNEAGHYALTCNWRTPHPCARLEGDTFTCPADGVTFLLRPSEPVQQQVVPPGGPTPVIQEGEAIPVSLLRQSKSLLAQPGAPAAFQNVFFVTRKGAERDFRLVRLDAFSVAVEGKSSVGPMKALLAVRRPDGHCRVAGWESDAACLYLGTDLAVAVQARVLRKDGRTVFSHKKARTVFLDRLPDAWLPRPCPGEETPAPALVTPETPECPLQAAPRFTEFKKRGPVLSPVRAAWTAAPGGGGTLEIDLGESKSLEEIAVLGWEKADRLGLALSDDLFASDNRLVAGAFEDFAALQPGTKGGVARVPSARIRLSGKARCLRLTAQAEPTGKSPAIQAGNVRVHADGPRKVAVTHLSPAISGQTSDSVLVGTEDGQFAVLNPDGPARWRKDLGVRIHHLRGLELKGEKTPRILVGTADARLFMFNSGGDLLWQRVVESRASAAGEDGPFQTPYGTSGPVFSSALWRPDPNGEPSLACAQYAAATYLSLRGEILGNVWLYGAYQMVATPYGLDVNGDGHDEIAFAQNWGGISIVQGKLKHIRDARRGPAPGAQGGSGSVVAPRGRPLFMDQWTPEGSPKPVTFLVTEEGVGAYDLATEKPAWEFPFSGPNTLAGAEDLGAGRRELWVARTDGFLVRLDTDGKSLGAVHTGGEIVGIARLKKGGEHRGVLVATRNGLLFFDPQWRLAGFSREPAQAAVTVPRGDDSVAAVALESGDILLLSFQ